MSTSFDSVVLNTMEVLGLEALINNMGFEIADMHRENVYRINATSPYDHDLYTVTRKAMMTELIKLVGERIAEVLDDEQLDCGESFHWGALRLTLNQQL